MLKSPHYRRFFQPSSPSHCRTSPLTNCERSPNLPRHWQHIVSDSNGSRKRRMTKNWRARIRKRSHPMCQQVRRSRSKISTTIDTATGNGETAKKSNQSTSARSLPQSDTTIDCLCVFLPFRLACASTEVGCSTIPESDGATSNWVKTIPVCCDPPPRHRCVKPSEEGRGSKRKSSKTGITAATGGKRL